MSKHEISSSTDHHTDIYVLYFNGYSEDSDYAVHFRNKQMAEEMMNAINEIMLLLPFFPRGMAEDEEQELKRISDEIVIGFKRPEWCSLELLQDMLVHMEYQRWQRKNRHADITLSVEELILPVYG
jgi:hypothetical protein